MKLKIIWDQVTMIILQAGYENNSIKNEHMKMTEILDCLKMMTF